MDNITKTLLTLWVLSIPVAFWMTNSPDLRKYSLYPVVLFGMAWIIRLIWLLPNYVAN